MLPKGVLRVAGLNDHASFLVTAPGTSGSLRDKLERAFQCLVVGKIYS